MCGSRSARGRWSERLSGYRSRRRSYHGIIQNWIGRMSSLSIKRARGSGWVIKHVVGIVNVKEVIIEAAIRSHRSKGEHDFIKCGMSRDDDIFSVKTETS